MGMSASQARLLSITARLTNNEFRAQTATNAKLRLAEETVDATAEYNDALNSKKLVFMNYDDNGEAAHIDLTPVILSSYEPLKNQYNIVNASGQALVTARDSKNFENSETLIDFLGKYNLTYDITDMINEQKENEYQNLYDNAKDYYDNYVYRNWEISHARWETDHADWETKHAQWVTDHAQWVIDHADWVYKNAHASDQNLYTSFINSVGNSQTATGAGNQYCYYHALHGNSGCYEHLLNHILAFEDGVLKSATYTTSIGTSITTSGSGGGMDPLTAENLANFMAISAALNDENLLCDGGDRFTPYYHNDGVVDKLEGNIIQEAIDDGRIPTALEQLMSDYKYDAATNTCTGLKTLKQKAIDIYYIIRNNLGTVSQRTDLLISYTEGDLKGLAPGPEPIEPEEPKEPIEPEMPIFTPPTEPEEDPKRYALIRDQKQAQWYTNLWFKMNGGNNANVVKPFNFDNEGSYYDCLTEELKRDYPYIVEDAVKGTGHGYYKVLDDNLAKSSEWLQFALEQGVVSLEVATYINPSDIDNREVGYTTIEGYTWRNLAYTSAKDFVTVDDEAAVAKAEVVYKNKIKDIKDKDKKYDQDLKKLDIEHNALQTEFESIKNVINKNTERSFKLFS